MGPLSGYTVLEFAGIGPGPFCAMLLADMGARVIRIDRPPEDSPFLDIDPHLDVTVRGRQSLALDLKHPRAVAAVLRLIPQVDVLIEGFRPGVMERLGLGPGECQEANPGLVYGRMTGYGQTGTLARSPGHDINYLAMSGCLHMFGRPEERPTPPLNLLADMGGGGLLLAFAITCALLERARSGRGQAIDASMCEGTSLLATGIYALRGAGFWQDARGSNLLDTGAPFYEVYATSDDRFIAVGAIEPQFYAALLAGLGLDPESLPPQMERVSWPDTKRLFARVFATRTRDQWAAQFAGTDACVTPVLDPDEAMTHEHHLSRGAFTATAGVVHPAPAPRFGRTPAATTCAPPAPGQDSAAVLREFGFTAEEIAELRSLGALV